MARLVGVDPSPERSAQEQQAADVLRAALRPGSAGADEVRGLVAQTLAAAARRRHRRRAWAPVAAAAAAGVVAFGVVLLPAAVGAVQDDGATTVAEHSAVVQELPDDAASAEPSGATAGAPAPLARTAVERHDHPVVEPWRAAVAAALLVAAVLVLVFRRRLARAAARQGARDDGVGRPRVRALSAQVQGSPWAMVWNAVVLAAMAAVVLFGEQGRCPLHGIC